MNIDSTGVTSGILDQSFAQDEKVMIRRFGDGMEYRARIAGISNDAAECKTMICELIDPIGNYPYSHLVVTEACIDKEIW